MSTQEFYFSPFNSKEEFLFANSVKSKLIYIIIIVIILVVFILLPVIKVNLSVHSRGIIRPITEKTEIKAVLPEIVNSIKIKEGQFVHKGDTLVTLRQDIIQSKISFLHYELEKRQLFINDLGRLISSQKIKPGSDLFIGQLDSYIQKIDELNYKIDKATIEINRNKNLFEKELISAKEYEDLEYRLKQLENERRIVKSNQVAQWKSDLELYLAEFNEFKKQLNELEKQKQFYIITTPVSGTIEEFPGIYIGSILQTGQTIAVVSPESEKIAEVYVSAKDIGYLSKGQAAKIQIDAFNYNQWGMLQGEIIDISEDFILVDNTPVFLVKCKLIEKYLELENGVRGEIKKGMTVNARFIVTKRSLFQLLYQKSDDWLNPSRSLASH